MGIWSSVGNAINKGYTAIDKAVGGRLPGGVAPTPKPQTTTTPATNAPTTSQQSLSNQSKSVDIGKAIDNWRPPGSASLTPKQTEIIQKLRDYRPPSGGGSPAPVSQGPGPQSTPTNITPSATGGMTEASVKAQSYNPQASFNAYRNGTMVSNNLMNQIGNYGMKEYNSTQLAGYNYLTGGIVSSAKSPYFSSKEEMAAREAGSLNLGQAFGASAKAFVDFGKIGETGSISQGFGKYTSNIIEPFTRVGMQRNLTGEVLYKENEALTKVPTSAFGVINIATGGKLPGGGISEVKIADVSKLSLGERNAFFAPKYGVPKEYAGMSPEAISSIGSAKIFNEFQASLEKTYKGREGEITPDVLNQWNANAQREYETQFGFLKGYSSYRTQPNLLTFGGPEGVKEGIEIGALTAASFNPVTAIGAGAYIAGKSAIETREAMMQPDLTLGQKATITAFGLGGIGLGAFGVRYGGKMFVEREFSQAMKTAEEAKLKSLFFDTKGELAGQKYQFEGGNRGFDIFALVGKGTGGAGDVSISKAGFAPYAMDESGKIVYQGGKMFQEFSYTPTFSPFTTKVARAEIDILKSSAKTTEQVIMEGKSQLLGSFKGMTESLQTPAKQLEGVGGFESRFFARPTSFTTMTEREGKLMNVKTITFDYSKTPLANIKQFIEAGGGKLNEQGDILSFARGPKTGTKYTKVGEEILGYKYYGGFNTDVAIQKPSISFQRGLSEEGSLGRYYGNVTLKEITLEPRMLTKLLTPKGTFNRPTLFWQVKRHELGHYYADVLNVNKFVYKLPKEAYNKLYDESYFNLIKKYENWGYSTKEAKKIAYVYSERGHIIDEGFADAFSGKVPSAGSFRTDILQPIKKGIYERKISVDLQEVGRIKIINLGKNTELENMFIKGSGRKSSGDIFGGSNQVQQQVVKNVPPTFVSTPKVSMIELNKPSQSLLGAGIPKMAGGIGVSVLTPPLGLADLTPGYKYNVGGQVYKRGFETENIGLVSAKGGQQGMGGLITGSNLGVGKTKVGVIDLGIEKTKLFTENVNNKMFGGQTPAFIQPTAQTQFQPQALRQPTLQVEKLVSTGQLQNPVPQVTPFIKTPFDTTPFKFSPIIPFGFPSALLDEGSTARKQKGRKYKRVPSIAAEYFGYKSTTQAPLEIGGFVTRPILVSQRKGKKK